VKRPSRALPPWGDTRPGAAPPPAACEPRPAGALVRAAMALGARPAIRLTLRESDDVEGDIALLRSLADLLRAYPGESPLVMNIVTAGGERHAFLWRVEACRELRLALSALLRAQAVREPRGAGN
jgi:hypothetical protein